MTVGDYLRHKRRNEFLLWLVLLTAWHAANVLVSWWDIGRFRQEQPVWPLLIWQGSSGVMTLALIPVIVWFDRYFPLRRGRLARSVPAHLLFTLPWSVAHVGGMVAIRKLVYLAIGRSYEFGPWAGEFLYEYLKDFRSYFSLLALIYLYRLVLRRLQGEASFVAEGEETAPPPRPERFLVKKLGKEFLVKVDDVDWIEAAGNYVSLYVDGRSYLLRETMTGIEKRLSDQGFARVHRSAIVNLDRVKAIEPCDSGDARAHLTSGRTVPVSRRYRQELKNRLA